MSTHDSKAVLWHTVSALMTKHWGMENLNRLSREAKMSPGTSSRLKAQETSVGLEVLDKLAACFRCESWQLLVPGFDPPNPPGLVSASSQAVSLAVLFDGIEDEERRQKAYELISRLLAFAAPMTTR